jgi:integrase
MLQRHEECLLRGWLQGVSWATLGELYLDGASADETRATVDALRRRLQQKALRLEQPELAAAIRRDRRPGGAREADLRRALETIVALPDPEPRPDSAVAAWLPAAIAVPLEAHGPATLGAVAELLAARGPEFWHAIPRLGPQAARTVIAFFRDHAATLGALTWPPVPVSTSPVPPALPRAGIVPLEYLLVPEELDGRHGSNRASGRCRIDADYDHAAIIGWLNRWPADGHTYRTYRKEAERLLLWALLERGRAFSSLTTEDCLAYRRFLADPKPAARWVGSLKPRSSPEWRPFQGGLSERSRKQAEGILSALCDWLVGRRYLDSNPFEGLPKSRFTARLRVDRSFSEAQWRWLLDYAEQRCRASKGRSRRYYERLRLILRFAYGTGLRLHELVAARLEHLTFQDDDRQWWLQVEGKGQRLREVPLPASLWRELEASWTVRGLPKHPAAAPPDTPLLVSLRREPVRGDWGEAPTWREVALTPSGLQQTLKAFFREAGDALAGENEAEGRRLCQASTHWLRHTHGSHAVRRGVPIEIVRDNLGHSSLATTSIYIHGERDRRYREMAKLSGETAAGGDGTP